MAETTKKGLGRGIASLIGSDGPNIASLNKPVETPAVSSGETGNRRMVPVAYLEPGEGQPRRSFDQEKLEELAQSIKENGVLLPLIVRQTGASSYSIIAGERRWRAAQKAGLHEVPVLVESYSDEKAAEVSLIENIQREQLTAFEEALAYQALLDKYDYTQKQISERVGKSRSHIANLLRLLTLPKGVLDYLQSGDLTMGHARALIGQENAEALAMKIIAEGLNVRQAEALTAAKEETASGSAPAGSSSSSSDSAKDADTVALEKQIAVILGMGVSLKHKGDAGTLVLSYKSLDQLDDFLARIGADI